MAMAGQLFTDQLADELGDRVRSIFTDEDRIEVERALRRGLGLGMGPDVWLAFSKRLYVRLTAIEREIVEHRKRRN